MLGWIQAAMQQNTISLSLLIYILILLGDHRDLPQPWTLYAMYLKHCKIHRKTQSLANLIFGKISGTKRKTQI